jgi:hypothetical protein
MNGPEEIIATAKKMRTFISGPHTLAEVLEIFGDFKQKCPHLFELVLENKGNYMEELEAMGAKAKMVKEGAMSYSNATKVVKNVFDNKFIFPVIKNNLTPQQKLETDEFIKKQQQEAEEIMKKSSKTDI